MFSYFPLCLFFIFFSIVLIFSQTSSLLYTFLKLLSFLVIIFYLFLVFLFFFFSIFLYLLFLPLSSCSFYLSLSVSSDSFYSSSYPLHCSFSFILSPRYHLLSLPPPKPVRHPVLFFFCVFPFLFPSLFLSIFHLTLPPLSIFLVPLPHFLKFI